MIKKKLIAISFLFFFLINYFPAEAKIVTLEEAIAQLNSSQELVDYLNNNFTFNRREGETAISPEEFLVKKEGGEQDFSSFAAYILYQNDFVSFVFTYRYIDVHGREGVGFVTSLRDTDEPKYIYFNEHGAHLKSYGWLYVELAQEEERRLNVNIKDYATISPMEVNLVPQTWIEMRGQPRSLVKDEILETEEEVLEREALVKELRRHQENIEKIGLTNQIKIRIDAIIRELSVNKKEDASKILEFEDPRMKGVALSKTYQISEISAKETFVREDGGKEIKSIAIKGEGPLNSVVFLFVYGSSFFIADVETDLDGNWDYLLEENLDDGKYEVYVSSVDEKGKIISRSGPVIFTKNLGIIETYSLKSSLPDSSEEQSFFFDSFLILISFFLLIMIISFFLIIVNKITISRKKEE